VDTSWRFIANMNGDEAEFYLTLLSNNSMAYFPENKTSTFCNQLPKTVHLEGSWVVGVSEIMYPCSIISISDEENTMYFKYVYELASALDSFFSDVRVAYWVDDKIKSGKYKSIDELIANKHNFKNIEVLVMHKEKIEAGNYGTIEDIVTALNSHVGFLRDNVNFNIHPGSRKIAVACTSPHLAGLYLTLKLSLMLGFEPNQNILNKTSPYSSNILLGIPSQIFLYTDIIEPQSIGDVYAKVIRAAVIDSKSYMYGSHQVQMYNQPHYIPVMKREFENILIDIRTATGAIPIRDFVFKLHFKRAKKS
jgi:hypothetical protein